MNLLATGNQPLTMSSREIASLTSKRHDNVRRTIESLWDLALISVTQSEEPTVGGGKPTKIYHVNEEDSYIVVARLSPEFTAKIVKRWRELEKQQAPQIPQTYAEALQLAADQAKQLELAAPKVAFVDNLVERTNLLTATQVAQKHGKSAIWLNKILEKKKVYNRRVKRTRAFQQWFVDKGYGEMKKNEMGYDQPLFTNAGEVWINEQLFGEGLI
jgi:phage regulator Rha-like protein